MESTIELLTKTDAFQFLWLKGVRGFDQRHHCYDCLKGTRSEVIPTNGGAKYPAGFSAAGRIAGSAPYAYLCAVMPSARGIAGNVHVLMEPDAGSTFVHEDGNIRVVVTGMRRLEIEPLPEEVQKGLPELFWRCRNFQAGWQLFPRDWQPVESVPVPEPEAGPA